MPENTKDLKLTVELRGAPLPKPLNKIATHLYFVIYREKPNDNINLCERWELWETKNAFQKKDPDSLENNDQDSYGHIHKNLKAPNDGVGGGPSFLVKTWIGENALKINQTIYSCNDNFSYKAYYLPWPGPNSNTYISSILEKSRIPYSLPISAIGKDWRGLFQYKKDRETKSFIFQILTFGFKYVANRFWEIHFLGFTYVHHHSTEKQST
ncbi:MAG: hypothetical protein COA79_12055 [Planctomycetota bacterium]|nr:MAG: hypothetical protein COA79_12055 [Planctomycetota bacterium]